MDITLGNRLIQLRARIVDKFNAGNWEEIGLLTGASGKRRTYKQRIKVPRHILSSWRRAWKLP